MEKDLVKAEEQLRKRGSVTRKIRETHTKFSTGNAPCEQDMQFKNVTVTSYSSVGIANGYGLDGPGIESRWGRDFSHTSRPTLEPTQPPIQWVLGLSRG
jgi:hypothetical protein